MDSDEALDIFLKLNPILKETATVKGAKFFVRCDPPDGGKIRNGDGEDVGDCLSNGQQGVVLHSPLGMCHSPYGESTLGSRRFSERPRIDISTQTPFAGGRVQMP